MGAALIDVAAGLGGEEDGGLAEDLADGGGRRICGIELTEKQARWVEEFLLHGNGTVAAVRAGYGGSHRNRQMISYQMRKNPVIKEVLTRAWFERRRRYHVTEGTVVSMLVEAYREGMDTGQIAAAVNAARYLGETFGMFSEVKLHKFGGQSDDDVAADAVKVFAKLGKEVDKDVVLEMMRERQGGMAVPAVGMKEVEH